jgi:hypothetical protein
MDSQEHRARQSGKKPPSNVTLHYLVTVFGLTTVKLVGHLFKRIDALEQKLAQVQTIKYLGTWEYGTNYETDSAVTTEVAEGGQQDLKCRQALLSVDDLALLDINDGRLLLV